MSETVHTWESMAGGWTEIELLPGEYCLDNGATVSRLVSRSSAVVRREYPTADDRVFVEVEVEPAIEVFDPVSSPEFVVESGGAYRIVRRPGRTKLTRDA